MDATACTALLATLLTTIRDGMPPRPVEPPEPAWMNQRPSESELASRKRDDEERGEWELKHNPVSREQREALQKIIDQVQVPEGWVSEIVYGYENWNWELHAPDDFPRPNAHVMVGTEHRRKQVVLAVSDTSLVRNRSVFHYVQPPSGVLPLAEFRCVLHAVAQSWTRRRRIHQ